MSSSTRKPQQTASAFVSASQWDAKHLADMVSRVQDPLVADILIGLLEEHPDLKMQYLGVYTKAWETLRRAEQIREKAYEAGQKYADRRRKVSMCVTWSVRVLRDFFRLVRQEIQKSRAKHNEKQAVKPASAKPQGENVICLPMVQRPTGTDR
ncbi:hypothetical protein [Delftia tsuruhatensis]|uniref:hypothetical protein n=1 Tax=Delftia tsuruhatensis TaxID=180282 RepID=UPI00289AFA7B|nr:hypothetical protein [Delftia tsuruhatensis]